jgi:PIN domain nuclease of toxin-antitoxin system
MRLLLDTVVLIFAVESPERLARRATALLRNTENILELSAISLSEIAIKAARGKLRLSAADTHSALEDLDLRILPYTAHHAFYPFDLPLQHADPFDRQSSPKPCAKRSRWSLATRNSACTKNSKSSGDSSGLVQLKRWWTLPLGPNPHEPRHPEPFVFRGPTEEHDNLWRSGKGQRLAT